MQHQEPVRAGHRPPSEQRDRRRMSPCSSETPPYGHHRCTPRPSVFAGRPICYYHITNRFYIHNKLDVGVDWSRRGQPLNHTTARASRGTDPCGMPGTLARGGAVWMGRRRPGNPLTVRAARDRLRIGEALAPVAAVDESDSDDRNTRAGDGADRTICTSRRHCEDEALRLRALLQRRLQEMGVRTPQPSAECPDASHSSRRMCELGTTLDMTLDETRRPQRDRNSRRPYAGGPAPSPLGQLTPDELTRT